MNLQTINQKIHEIRNKKVILDFDLASLYDVETKRLKEAVKRNITRFPEDFMFVLTPKEFESLRTQFATSKRGGNQYLPFAFTEQGVAMLSSVLNSEKAISMNIQIIRAFVLIRQFALSHIELSEKLVELENKFDQKFNDIYDALNYLLNKDKLTIGQENRQKIGFISPDID